VTVAVALPKPPSPKYETGRVSPTLKTLEYPAAAVDLQVVVSFVPAPDGKPVVSADQPPALKPTPTDSPEARPKNGRVELWTV
jgi:hypothetical protein